MKNPDAQQLGRLGGLAKSAAKSAAALKNEDQEIANQELAQERGEESDAATETANRGLANLAAVRGESEGGK